MWIVGGCGPSVTRRMDPSHKPLSRSIFVYLRYGPKYTPFVGATLYTSTPLDGGGPVKPVTVGVADCILMTLSAYPGVDGMKPGDARGCFPYALSPGESRGLPPYTLTEGEVGSFRLRGVGPLGNSHCVD